MNWFAQAPANIALIKYMGKKEGELNLPDNSSLSYTLNNLLTTVTIEKTASKKDVWEPLNTPGSQPFALSDEAQARYLKHLGRIKEFFNYSGGFLVQSSNNFPHSSGLASSASSFAALTKCGCLAMSELTGIAMPTIDVQAQISRQGSGSSCRSFYSPWALWKDEKVESIDLPYEQLIHQVIVISSKEKKVSSSLAHQRVKSSPLYATRSQRAEENLTVLLDVLRAKDWSSAYHLCWREFQDMHHLFSSCSEPFSYMTEDSLTILHRLQDYWEQKGDGPIITMDAGPNIHLLYREDQTEIARQIQHDYLVGNYDVL